MQYGEEEETFVKHTNLDFTSLREKNVVGLDITVNAMHVMNINKSLESLLGGKNLVNGGRKREK